MSTIREKESGITLATAPDGSDMVVTHEGNIYFDTSAIDEKFLRVSDRTYTCPVKGICHWIDFIEPLEGRTVRDIGWVYNKTNPGHEAIQGKYGFYAGNRGGTKQD